MRVAKKAGVWLGLVLLGWFAAHGPADAATTEQQQRCSALVDQQLDNVALLSSAIVPASSDHPEFCRVRGYVLPAINFEVRLPTLNWNRKFYMSGCGGLCGQLGDEGALHGRYFALSRGYAVAFTDTGHWGRDLADARWAYANLQAREDYAFRGVHETARVSKQIIAGFYGAEVHKSYFDGCSNGGRQGLIEAQRYPEDFDGIIAGCAVTDMAGFVAQWIWNVQVDMDEDGRPVFNSSKLGMLSAAVQRRCGDQEGVIADPRRCDFEPSQIECSGADRPDCLTAREVRIVERWYQGPRLSSGVVLHEGVPRGSERDWLLGVANHTGANFLMNAYARYLLFEPPAGPDLTAATFDLEQDLPRAAPMLRMLSADNPDLSAFRARGGKLLIYTGWADALATPGTMITYYESVARAVGRDDTQDFVRLFLVPGMGHIPMGIDPLSALERWVEEDEAPQFLTYTRSGPQGRVLWTRPVCAYPLEARYGGHGDRGDAMNWRCRSEAH